MNNDDDLTLLTQQELDARIIDAFSNTDDSIRQVAKKCNVSWSKARRVLESAGLTDADRIVNHNRHTEVQKAANAARLENVKARQVELAALLTEDVFRMRDRTFAEYTMMAPGLDGPVEVVLDEPPLKEQADATKAIEALQRTVAAITDGVETVSEDNTKSVMADLLNGLKAVVAETPDLGIAPEDQEPPIIDENADQDDDTTPEDQ